MNQNESLIAVIALLYKWKKHILGASFLAAVICAAASLTLPNYFASHTLFYAANPDLAAPMPISESSTKRFVFGDDTDLDRLFSISKSSIVLTKLNEKYNLYEHYGIKPDAPLAEHKMNQKFNKLYQVTKTKYDAIDLSVEDIDPVFATSMANDARIIIDQQAQKLIKESQRKQLSSFNSTIDSKQREYQQLLDSLNVARTKYNIFSTDAQGEAYGSSMVEVEGKQLKAAGTLSYLKQIGAPSDTIAKMEALKVGLDKQLDKLKKNIQNYNQGYPLVKNLERVTRDFSASLNIDKTRVAALQSTYDANITAIHIIEEAAVPPYKSRPKRSIMVIGVAFLTFVLMSLWVILRDQFKKNNWREAFKNV